MAPKFLLTAGEAYPEFERLVLEARDEVLISMRMFDPETHLQSARGRDVGDTWADLITRKLDEGVRFRIYITDFDPVARPVLHEYSWRCVMGLRMAGARSSHPDRLEACALMHPARVSWGHRLTFLPLTRSKIKATCRELNAAPRQEATDRLAHMPAFRALVAGQPGRLRPKFWPPAALVPATHHQKMAVIDGETLYVGGLDLNPRRYDDKSHRRDPEKTWHDVQVIETGTAAHEARRHILDLDALTAGDCAPERTERLLRTLSADRGRGRRAIAPREVLTELEDTHLRLIDAARDFIYIETQFLRSSTITEALERAARREPELSLIVLLPAAPEDVAFDRSSDLDARYGEQLQREAVERIEAAFGDRVFFGAPAQPRKAVSDHRDTHFDAPIIYIHAKVLIVDGKAAVVSSANLNGRSLHWDTETGLAFETPDDARRLFERCVAHWFPDEKPAHPEVACDWAEMARAASRMEPTQRPHFMLPYDPTPAAELGTPVPGMPEEMV